MKKIIFSIFIVLMLYGCKCEIKELDIYKDIGGDSIVYPSWFKKGKYISTNNLSCYIIFYDNFFEFYVVNTIDDTPFITRMQFPSKKVKITEIKKDSKTKSFELLMETKSTSLKFIIIQQNNLIDVKKEFRQGGLLDDTVWINYKLSNDKR